MSSWLPAGETFTWRLLDGFDSGRHRIMAGRLDRCLACCCAGPEPCKDCGGMLHREPDQDSGTGGHNYRCDRRYCRCWACPDLSTGTGWPKDPEGWHGARQGGKQTAQAAKVDAAIRRGEHVHVAGRDGLRCFNGGKDCTSNLVPYRTGG
jgi:hypothetical protein